MRRWRIIAHRGASHEAPENTLTAFRLALDQGADAVECDLALTRDGEMVILHDDTVDRTTDGTGPVASFLYRELRRLNAGHFRQPERIPHLEEVLELLAGRAGLNLELKVTGGSAPNLEERVLACLSRFGMLDETVISSFAHHNLRRLKELEPACRTGILYVAGTGVAPAMAQWAQADALHPFHSLVSAELMQQAAQADLAVYAWTVNDPATARHLCRLGVTGIITDQPAALRAAFCA